MISCVFDILLKWDRYLRSSVGAHVSGLLVLLACVINPCMPAEEERITHRCSFVSDNTERFLFTFIKQISLT